MIEAISAVTLATHDMARAVAFYEKLGFHIKKGGAKADFTTFRVGITSFNLIKADARRQWSWWGRLIFYVADVDAVHAQALAAGLAPDFAPADADWGERYFHITDPDGHEISFAAPL
ncbi:MAG: VOC family protein [Alphaproteobacteria bacterium]|nr:MAG: VOC family protein [Alphaproteobacteria bacterium]